MLSLASLVLGACAAQPPAPPVQPLAVLEFPPLPARYNEWVTTLEMTTEGGAAYALPLVFDKTSNEFQWVALRQLLAANWMAEPDRGGSLTIHGARKRDGTADRVKTLVATNRVPFPGGALPKLVGGGGAKVETREATGPEKPPAAKVPAGPDLGPEPFVEFDFSPVPSAGEGLYDLRFTVRTANETLTYSEESSYARTNGPEVTCLLRARRVQIAGFKAEVVGKTRLRVYGCVHNGHFYRAVEGRVESLDLAPGELPKVTNPPRAKA